MLCLSIRTLTETRVTMYSSAYGMVATRQSLWLAMAMDRWSCSHRSVVVPYLITRLFRNNSPTNSGSGCRETSFGTALVRQASEEESLECFKRRHYQGTHPLPPGSQIKRRSLARAQQPHPTTVCISRLHPSPNIQTRTRDKPALVFPPTLLHLDY